MKTNPFNELKTEPLELDEKNLQNTFEEDDYILAVVTATKPDFYKQWPLIPAAKKHKMPLFVINTGQHYDNILGHGLKEFNINDYIALNLNIRGDLSQKTSELTIKINWFANYIKKHYPKKTIIPIVHGDTHAAGIVPLAWMFSTNQKCAQNEAGLRSMGPDYRNYKNIEKFIDDQFNRQWTINRSEPFPEQYDTFISAAASHYHFAPTKLNRDNLIREGYSSKNIYEVGNSVVDAIEHKRKENKKDSIFTTYPILEAEDKWIRIDIHRRENLLPERFSAIISGVIKLVEKGYNINFINMTATGIALKNYGLEEKMKRLEQSHKNFLFTCVWPVYGHVIEFLESGKCFAEFTDSGSMQEELNEINKPLCLTARYTTDRPETVMDANTNILIPPISGEYIENFISHIEKDAGIQKQMHQGKKLYGRNVGEKIIKIIKKTRDHPFEWAHDTVGINKTNQNKSADKNRHFDFL